MKNIYQPYSIYGHQELSYLKHSDYARRVNFRNSLLIQHAFNPRCARNILSTSECLFSEDGSINCHNDHHWKNTNPFFVHEVSHQQWFSVFMWSGIWNNTLTGLVSYEGTITDHRYHDLILNVTITDFMENTAPLKVYNCVWFQQDDGPPHNKGIASNYINTEFGFIDKDKQIGQICHRL